MNNIHPALANLLRVLEQEAREGPAYEGKNFFESDVIRMAMEWARRSALDEASAVLIQHLPARSRKEVTRLIAEQKRIPSLVGVAVGRNIH